MRPCPDCGGSGDGRLDIDGNDYTDCPRCGGSGVVDDDEEEYEDDDC